MDPLQFIGLVAISAGVGFLAAQQKYSRQIKSVQAAVFTNNLESITRITKAAIETFVEDYKLDEAEATGKFFARCGALGMKLVRIDSTGDRKVLTNPEDKPKS